MGCASPKSRQRPRRRPERSHGLGRRAETLVSRRRCCLACLCLLGLTRARLRINGDWMVRALFPHAFRGRRLVNRDRFRAGGGQFERIGLPGTRRRAARSALPGSAEFGSNLSRRLQSDGAPLLGPEHRKVGQALDAETARKPTSAIGVSARNPRRFGRETFRPQHGSASPPVLDRRESFLPGSPRRAGRMGRAFRSWPPYRKRPSSDGSVPQDQRASPGA